MIISLRIIFKIMIIFNKKIEKSLKKEDKKI